MRERFWISPRRPQQGRGSVDAVYLLLVCALLAFGAVMSFSASAAYATQFYGDSAYFFKRYLLFAALSVLATTPFVLCAKPAFWRLAGVALNAFPVF